MNRRDWFSMLLKSIAVFEFQSRLVAGEAKRAIPFGYSLYGMKNLPLAEAFAVLGKIGYDGIELALMPGYPSEPKLLPADDRKSLRKQLSEQRLQLLCLMENLNEPATPEKHASNLERLKSAAQLGHDFGLEMPIIETILGGKPGTWSTIREAVYERLAAWVKVAEAAKCVIAIKPHVGNALRSPRDAVDLVKHFNSPHLKLAYDYSHLLLQKISLAESIEQMIPYSVFIHIKDAVGTPEKFTFTLPGTGGTDYAAYAKALAKTKYDGAIVVEVSSLVFNAKGYDPVVAAKTCYEQLAPSLAALRGKR